MAHRFVTVFLLVAIGFAILIPLTNGWDLLSLAYLFVALPIVGLVAIAYAAVRKSMPLFLAILVLLSSAVLVLRNVELVRERERWFLFSRRYKSELLSTPNKESSLPHMEWDGWGGFGAGDTTLYLVFDPGDALEGIAKSGAPGRIAKLPCEVAQVRRLEKHWYSVLTYTDTDWDHCS